MKIYSISVLDGRETIIRDVILHFGELMSVIKSDIWKENFIIVDVYMRKEYKNLRTTKEQPAELQYSSIYLRGEEIMRTKEAATFEDIESAKGELTCVIRSNGTRYYVPPFPLTVSEVQQMAGVEVYTMAIVKDEPNRWAVISTDAKAYNIDPPVRNDVASELFGKELYGNVIYINEDLVA